jgi:hypothetical protein
MPVEISVDTPAPLVPLAWLLGRWEGVGVVGYPTVEERRFGQEVEFRHDGRPFLHYRSQAWQLDDEGRQVRPLASETGYWRVPLDGEGRARLARDADGSSGIELEVLLSHPTGITEVYLGRATGARVDLATDVVARTGTAKEYTAARRMYGQVEGDLLWVMDMAAVGQPMTSHASARLRKVA